MTRMERYLSVYQQRRGYEGCIRRMERARNRYIIVSNWHVSSAFTYNRRKGSTKWGGRLL